MNKSIKHLSQCTSNPLPFLSFFKGKQQKNDQQVNWSFNVIFVFHLFSSHHSSPSLASVFLFLITSLVAFYSLFNQNDHCVHSLKSLSKERKRKREREREKKIN